MPETEADKPGLLEQLHGLYADGRELIDAEISFQKARMAAAGRQVRAMAALVFVGLVLIGCALIALVVGTMIALIPYLGAWGAMGATVLATLILAALAFWLAVRRIGRVGALFADENAAADETKASA
ncbi:MAG: hypothetical protein A2792_11800 [Sphingomonadales bacterium RIFCSPHIGHO2_01_FULL_65_20]|nr:MAG: hypothetical protein A2792_11800 [Sphingomonadales bacterium RIFCSPHIGHO2_01_FULL_65_20]